MTPPDAPAAPARVALVLLGLTAIAAALFLFRIGAPSLWFDEAYSVDMVQDGFALLDLDRGIEVNGMAVYYTLLGPWIRVSLDEGWIRLLSAVFAIATVPVTWLLARRLFDERIATTASVLLVVSAFTIRFAQEARSYSLLLFFAAVSTYLLVRAIQRPTWKAWLAYGLVAGLIPYTQVLGTSLLLVHAFAALVHRPRPPWSRILVAIAIVSVAMVPMAFIAVRFAGSAVGWIPDPSFAWVTEQLLALGGGEIAGGPNTRLRAVVGAVALMLAAAGALVALGLIGRRRPTWAATVVLVWFVAPIVLSILVSFVKPILVARYLIATLPAMAILGALAIDAIPSPRWRAGAFAGIVAVALVGVGAYYVDQGRADWRGAAAWIERHGTERDRWLVDPTWSWRPLVFHVDRSDDPDAFPRRLWRELDSTNPETYPPALGRTAAELAAEGRTIWAVVTGSSAGTTDVSRDSRYAPFLESYRATEMVEFDRITVIRFEPIG